MDAAAIEQAVVPPRDRWHATLHGSGPVFVVGDVHGCADELEDLLRLNEEGGQVVFVGDLVNKGPFSQRCVDIALREGALCVRGNHEQAVLSALAARRAAAASGDTTKGSKPKPSYAWTDELSDEQVRYIADMPFTVSIPAHDAIVVHAGLVPGVPLEEQTIDDMVRMRHLKRGANGEWVALEKPVFCAEGMVPWATQWPTDQPHVIFGHDAVRQIQAHPNATGVDGGCLYGRRLAAMKLPSRQVYWVDAKKQYIVPSAVPRRGSAGAAGGWGLGWPVLAAAVTAAVVAAYVATQRLQRAESQ